MHCMGGRRGGRPLPPPRPAPPVPPPRRRLRGRAKAMAQSGALIFLHGLGDTEQGWMALSGMLRQRAPHLRYVTATAPVMPVTVNMGMRMTSWFDMDAIPVLPETVDDKASIESVGMRALSGLIDETIASGIPPERIVVGGFSQGGCVAMSTALTHPKTLGGVLNISGWLPSFIGDADAIRAAAEAAGGVATRPPLAWGHGEADPTVTFARAQPNGQAWKEAGLELEFTSYPNVGHDCTSQELDWALDWVAQRLPPL
eukprot:PRCOL_00003009-RA